MNALRIGQEAELFVCRYLLAQKLQLKTRNYRCYQGEIDLVMQEGHCIVFVEVRLRHNETFGSGNETVINKKQQRIIKTATHYLQRYRLFDQPCRFDVISLTGHSDPWQVNWIKNAFSA